MEHRIPFSANGKSHTYKPHVGDLVKYDRQSGYRVIKIRPNGSVLIHPPAGSERKPSWISATKLTVEKPCKDGEEWPDLPKAESPDEAPPVPIITEGNLDEVPWYRLRNELFLGNGRWFQVYTHLPLIMKEREAWTLCFLANWQHIHGNKEWFYCTTQTITENAFLGPRRQEHIFRELRTGGWIETKQIGKRGKRWIRIDYLKVCKAINAAYRDWNRQLGYE